MKSRHTIQTERLVLREIEINDTEHIIAWRSDPEIYCYFKNPHALTVGEHMEWYQNRYLRSDGVISWIAIEKSGWNAAGVYGARRTGSSAEISYLTSKQFRNRGYGTECIRAVVQWCRDCWGVKDVYAEIHADNKKSMQFIQSLGFHEKMKKGDFAVFVMEV